MLPMSEPIHAPNRAISKSIKLLGQQGFTTLYARPRTFVPNTVALPSTSVSQTGSTLG